MDLFDWVFAGLGLLIGSIATLFGSNLFSNSSQANSKASPERQVKDIQIQKQILEDENKLLKSKVETLEKALDMSLKK